MSKFPAKLTKSIALAASTFLASAQLAIVSAQVNPPVTDISPGTGFATDIGSLFNFILRVVIILAILIVFGFLIFGGIEYITSGGEKSKTESARNKITAAIVGLVILAASYAVFLLLWKFFGFTGGLSGAINNVGTISNPGTGH